MAAGLTLPGYSALAADKACEIKATKISKIQGSEKHSPLKDMALNVNAVVSAVMPSMNGYYLVEEAKDWDKSDKTSEGIFVFDKKNKPKVGDLVAIKAKVAEFKDLTQLEKVSSFSVCGSNHPIKRVEVSLPFEHRHQMENVEGMPVVIKQALTISENYSFSRYGQLLLSNGRLFQPTNVGIPGRAANKVRLQNQVNQIILDDGSGKKNPAINFDVNHPYRVGNQVKNIEGVVHYSFGKYMIEPTAKPEFIRLNARKQKPQVKTKGSLRVASFNVLNYFNGNGDEKAFPTQRGANTKAEFDRQNAKTVAAMKVIGADVLGLMEVENDGFGKHSAIAQLTNNLRTASGLNYVFVKPQSDKIGEDSITVGIIYNADTVSAIGKAATLTMAPFGTLSRLPLAQSFKQKSNGEVFTVVVNHFKSKGGCPKDKGNINGDNKDGQGCWNDARTQSAKLLLKWLSGTPTSIDDKDVLIIGDLNAYAKESPVTALEDAGYVNLIEHYQGKNAYSYVYRGLAGYLDHALASPSLNQQVVDTTDWHINADEMRITDYNLEGKSKQQQESLYRADAFRSSDHDPVIVELNLKQ